MESNPPRSGGTGPPATAFVDEPAVALGAAARTTLTKWLAMVAQGDFRDLPSIIALDAVYHSPVEWHPYPGRDLVCLLVRTAAGVFEDFKYQRTFANGDDAALEFSAHVGDIELKGAHLVRFNADGEIIDIDLIARPVKGALALGNGVGDKIGPQIKAALTTARLG
jgi:SnoaL-like domain